MGCERVCEKVGFRHFLIFLDGSDEYGAEIGGRRRCGWKLGHSSTSTRLVDESSVEIHNSQWEARKRLEALPRARVSGQ